MRKHWALLLAALAGTLMLVGAGNAFASPANCGEASRLVIAAKADLSAAEDKAKKDGLQAQIDSLVAGPAGAKSLVQLKLDVTAAQKKLNDNTDPTLVGVLTAALNTAKLAVEAREDAIKPIQIKLDAQVKLLADLKAKVDVAIADETKACNTTPTVTVSPSPVPVPTGDVDCSNLSYKEAQAVLKQNPTDPFGLDADKDGEACDFKRPVSDPVTPSGSVDTGGGPVAA